MNIPIDIEINMPSVKIMAQVAVCNIVRVDAQIAVGLCVSEFCRIGFCLLAHAEQTPHAAV